MDEMQEQSDAQLLREYAERGDPKGPGYRKVIFKKFRV